MICLKPPIGARIISTTPRIIQTWKRTTREWRKNESVAGRDCNCRGFGVVMILKRTQFIIQDKLNILGLRIASHMMHGSCSNGKGDGFSFQSFLASVSSNLIEWKTLFYLRSKWSGREQILQRIQEGFQRRELPYPWPSWMLQEGFQGTDSWSHPRKAHQYQLTGN